jgi:hypothetical protein
MAINQEIITSTAAVLLPLVQANLPAAIVLLGFAFCITACYITKQLIKLAKKRESE